ncbi:hypothetical protein EVAR_69026_1 [Eumeta japonica]|uniref:Uncharacterized protein n=1 Tax=Eumeta variegata TaxID=151549 RepID=A0A4C2A768_EUMVA|nr:hypothetical protein EVAR_69026_1 [Eumeta japonica]
MQFRCRVGSLHIECSSRVKLRIPGSAFLPYLSALQILRPLITTTSPRGAPSRKWRFNNSPQVGSEAHGPDLEGTHNPQTAYFAPDGRTARPPRTLPRINESNETLLTG